MRQTDTPGSEWYEPADILDDDSELEALAELPANQFVIGAGVVSWCSLVTNDSDSD
jgi:hypothetical protein